MERIPSDPENVHESVVVAEGRAAFGLICDRWLPPTPVARVAHEFAVGYAAFSADPRTGFPRPHLLGDALAVLRRAEAATYVASIGETDAVVIGRVWARSYHFRNAAVGGKIRQAVFDALAGCVDRYGNVVCAAGRAAAALSALALLDFDERTWGRAVFAMHRSEVFGAAALLAAEGGGAVEAGALVDRYLAGAGRHIPRRLARRLREEVLEGFVE